MSKALTAVAFGRMVARGEVSLDESPRASLPDLPEPYGAMTLRQVAGHLAGIPHYRGVDFVNTRHYDSAIAALSKFRDRPLVAAPGDRFLSSSFGWNLLGAVLEARAGKPFERIVRDEVLEPFVGATAGLWIVPAVGLVVAATANTNARGFATLLTRLAESRPSAERSGRHALHDSVQILRGRGCAFAWRRRAGHPGPSPWLARCRASARGKRWRSRGQ